jgi:predicted ATPase
MPPGGYLRSVRLERDTVESFDAYPFSIAAVRHLEELALDQRCTFLVGDNGTGKSTLIEAIAIAAGFNAEGGTKNFAFATRRSESVLHRHLRLVKNPGRPRDGFFLRAESLFNVATEIERLEVAAIRRVTYEETDHYRITQDFLANRDRFFKHLFADPDD